MEMLTDTDASGDYVIPKIIYSDAYSSEMVAFADLVLPDTTYLERHDCISLLDRPISEPDAAGDAIRWPVVEPDRPGHDGVRGFQSVLLDLGVRLGLPGMVDAKGEPIYRDYADYMVNHQRRPGVGPLAGWRGDGTADRAAARPIPTRSPAISRTAASGPRMSRPRPPISNPSTPPTRTGPSRMAFCDAPQPYLFQLYPEPLAKFQAAALGHGPHQPPDHLRAQLTEAMAPLPIWYPPLSDARIDLADFPLHAITQRPMAMYHSWGSQNAWLRQIHGQNPLYVPDRRLGRARLRGRRLGACHLAARPHHRARRAHGRAEPEHRLDLERHRQAPRRLGAVARRARGDQGLPAQPPDPRTAAAARRRHALVELRPGHRPGRLVRPARAHREGPAPDPLRSPRSPPRPRRSAAARTDVAYGREWANEPSRTYATCMVCAVATTHRLSAPFARANALGAAPGPRKRRGCLQEPATPASRAEPTAEGCGEIYPMLSIGTRLRGWRGIAPPRWAGASRLSTARSGKPRRHRLQASWCGDCVARFVHRSCIEISPCFRCLA